MARPWQMLSNAIDTLRLCVGVTLWALLSLSPMSLSPVSLSPVSLSPVSCPWPGMKLFLLVARIVRCSLALKRARMAVARRANGAAALGVCLFIATVALVHHPAGPWPLWCQQGG